MAFAFRRTVADVRCGINSRKRNPAYRRGLRALTDSHYADLNGTTVRRVTIPGLCLRNGYARVEVNVLDSVQQFDPFGHRTLERFTAAD